MRAPSRTVRFAKSLRQSMTPPEVMLWVRLRTLHAQGFRFRRQHPLGPYVLDFYLPELRLAVEVDGISHGTGGQGARDERRDAWLAERGVQVERLEAAEVLRNPDEAAQGIFQLIARRRA